MHFSKGMIMSVKRLSEFQLSRLVSVFELHCLLPQIDVPIIKKQKKTTTIQKNITSVVTPLLKPNICGLYCQNGYLPLARMITQTFIA